MNITSKLASLALSTAAALSLSAWTSETLDDSVLQPTVVGFASSNVNPTDDCPGCTLLPPAQFGAVIEFDFIATPGTGDGDGECHVHDQVCKQKKGCVVDGDIEVTNHGEEPVTIKLDGVNDFVVPAGETESRDIPPTTMSCNPFLLFTATAYTTVTNGNETSEVEVGSFSFKCTKCAVSTEN